MGSASGGWDPGPPLPQRSGGGGLPAPGKPDAMDVFRDDGTYMVLMKGQDHALKDSRPREIFKHLPKVIKEIHFCKKLNSGDYLIKINKSERDEVFQVTKIGDIPVVFEEPWDINRTKVTIKYKDIKKANNEELTQDLKAQNNDIVSAEIQTKWENDKRVNTEFAVVTIQGKFSELELESKKISLNFEKLGVQLHIPLPSRCKVCLAYDHFSSKNRPCTKPKMCGQCGDTFHLKTKDGKVVEKCSRPAKCINCLGNHPAWVSECRRYKEEKVIAEIATKQRVSYAAARRISTQQQKDKPKSYASKTMTLKPTDQQPIPGNTTDNINLNNDVTQILQRLEHMMSIVMQEIRFRNNERSDNSNDVLNDSDDDMTPSSYKQFTDNSLRLMQERGSVLDQSSLSDLKGLLGRKDHSLSESDEEPMDEERRSGKRGASTDYSSGAPDPKRLTTRPRGGSLGNNNPPPREDNRAARKKSARGLTDHGVPSGIPPGHR